MSVQGKKILSVVEWEGINMHLIILIVFSAPINSKPKPSTLHFCKENNLCMCLSKKPKKNKTNPLPQKKKNKTFQIND